MNRIKKHLLMEVYKQELDKNSDNHPIHWIEIEVTRRCQLNCIHCGSSCEEKNPYTDELSMDDIVGFMKKIAAVYSPKDIKVAFTGGEPLLRKDIFHIMAHVTEMGFRASIVTNGLLLNNDERIKLLAASGVRSLSISIDGLEQTHDKIRGQKGAFQKSMEAIQRLVESKLFYIEPITTVNPMNLGELAGLDELFTKTGVHSWRLGKTFPIGRAKEMPELFLSTAQFKELLDFIAVRYRDKKRPMPVSYCEEGFLGDYELEVRDFFGHCPAGINILCVLADGSMTGCAAADLGYIQGNIKQDDPIEVWENRYQVFRDRSWMHEGYCKECKQWAICRGDGFHNWPYGQNAPAQCNYSEVLKFSRK